MKPLIGICFLNVIWLVSCPGPQEGGAVVVASYGFQGHQSGDIDRIKIPLVNKSVNVGNDFTIEFWLKTQPSDNPGGTVNTSATDGSGWVGTHIILDRDIDDNSGSNEHGDWGIGMANGRIAFGVAKGSSGKTIYASSSADLRDGQWHHVAVTRQGSSATMRIYIDGQLGDQGIGPSGDVSYKNDRTTSKPNSDPYLVIAAEKHDYPGSLGYKGLLSGLRISNQVLYTSDFTPDQTTIQNQTGVTVALYLFDVWNGVDLTDVSGGGNHGVVKVGGSPSGPYPSTDRPFNP